jgi:hypothetical protein
MHLMELKVKNKAYLFELKILFLMHRVELKV